MEPHPEGVGSVTALIRIAFLVNAAYAESGREFGVTPQQGQVLSILRARAYAMGDLRAKLGLAKSTTTGIVEILERDGKVVRRSGVPTARSVQVSLTQDGRFLADRFYTATHRRVELLLEPLSRAEQATLRPLLAAMVDRDDVAVIFPTGAPSGPKEGAG
ncbi:MarR family winged helix-turn-helix transcriptional regulator [Nocardioides acrostichi]|uniref:MarR family transcriptional regulator n=1 Tax=Nocardioides acrostichi TaxID=2784339 RepID=A0A930UV81_9ACTN|nr:MarR family transcriptional regulator [Nocardioides acrostichi]MBF4160242.1 MarR family transcriptional regulator [Nocardioides acrostichi]